MKRLNLILIVTAFFAMATACTEAEKLSPDFPIGNETLSLSGIDAPNTTDAKLASYTTDPFNKNREQYRESDKGEEFSYGELLPLSFNDCGIFIQKTDGSFLEVQNTDLPAESLDAGGWVEFSYNADEALEGPCGLGVMVYLTHIRLINEEVEEEPPTSQKR